MLLIFYRDVGTGINSVYALFNIMGLGCLDTVVKACFKYYLDTVFTHTVSN